MREVMTMIRRAINEGHRAARGTRHLLKTLRKEEKREGSGWQRIEIVRKDDGCCTDYVLIYAEGTTLVLSIGMQDPSDSCLMNSVPWGYDVISTIDIADPDSIDKLAAALSDCGIPFSLPVLA